MDVRSQVAELAAKLAAERAAELASLDGEDAPEETAARSVGKSLTFDANDLRIGEDADPIQKPIAQQDTIRRRVHNLCFTDRLLLFPFGILYSEMRCVDSLS